MLNATVELFMSEYFLIKAVLGKHLKDGESLFRTLSKIFLIPKSEADRLYLLAENQTARAINTDKDFMQHQRIGKYSRLTGSSAQTNADWEEIVGVKGNAIMIAQNNNLLLDPEASGNVVYTCLSAAATAGAVSALRITGILQYEGIFFNKDEKAGIKNLSKAAGWNDSVSTLALLRYCKDTRGYNLARLRREVKYTPFGQLYALAAEKYGEADEDEPKEVRLLEKAFASGVLKRENYEPKYARILSSNAIHFKDKEKAVFTLNKELLCAISDLPLKLSQDKITAVDAGALKGVAVKREAEIAAIIRSLGNGDLRELSGYRPLCLCCGSDYILNMYARAIKTKTAKTHVEVIDIGELSGYDLEPTPDNIFVRSVDEDKDNRFLLFFRGDVSERNIDAVKSFLLSERRAKFHLNSPGVTLNLSAVLPVCFCDEGNAAALKAYCDVIRLSGVTQEEMPFAVEDIISTKVKTYGVSGIKLDGAVGEIFEGYDIDTAEKLIDGAVRSRREKGAVIVLTRDMLKEYALERDKQKIGFGEEANGRY